MVGGVEGVVSENASLRCDCDILAGIVADQRSTLDRLRADLTAQEERWAGRVRVVEEEWKKEAERRRVEGKELKKLPSMLAIQLTDTMRRWVPWRTWPS